MYVDYKCLLYRVRVFFFFHDFTISCEIYYPNELLPAICKLHFCIFILFDIYCRKLVALVTRKKMDLLQMLLI